MARRKNPFGKSRKVDNPYEIWMSADGQWEYRLLKKYALDDFKAYARWFLGTKSPYTYGSFELGDGYASDVMRHARKLTPDEMAAHLAK